MQCLLVRLHLHGPLHAWSTLHTDHARHGPQLYTQITLHLITHFCFSLRVMLGWDPVPQSSSWEVRVVWRLLSIEFPDIKREREICCSFWACSKCSFFFSPGFPFQKVPCCSRLTGSPWTDTWRRPWRKAVDRETTRTQIFYNMQLHFLPLDDTQTTVKTPG